MNLHRLAGRRVADDGDDLGYVRLDDLNGRRRAGAAGGASTPITCTGGSWIGSAAGVAGVEGGVPEPG